MNRVFILILICLWGIEGGVQVSHAVSAIDIMRKNENNRRLKDVHSFANLRTGGAGKKNKSKRFRWWKKLLSDGIHYHTFTRFLDPATVRGEGVLFLENSQGDSEVLLYLPRFKKIRRVENQNQSGSFMGSVFSYSDISTPHIDDYSYKFLREEKCLNGKKIDCYVIESVPSSEKILQRTRYGKIENWIRKDNFMVAHAKYYNMNEELVKKLDASRIIQVDPKLKKWMAHSLRMERLKDGRFTHLQFEQTRVNKGIDDSIFTRQNLSKIK